LVLRVGLDGIPPAAARTLAKKIVRTQLVGTWVVKPMGAASRDFTVRRAAAESNPTVKQAFAFAYKLREHRDVEDCEPALTMPCEAPDEMIAEHFAMRAFAGPQTASAKSSSSSSSGADDEANALPCTAQPTWALKRCKVFEAWVLKPSANGKALGEGIVIGHPDTGYTDHPELDSARVLKTRGRDFDEGKADPRDTLKGQSGGHGTSTGSVLMSGTAAGVVSGVAPLAKLVPLRVTSHVVLLSFSKLAEAIRYAADDGQHVISISLGGPLGSRFLTRAVQYAISRGVIVVAAAGNVWPFVVYPAQLTEVIAVAACNCQQKPWSSTASGAAVDITAPGESVWRALARSDKFTTGRSSGTSYATAITAGAAALWLSHHGRDDLIQRFGLSGLAAVFKELLIEHAFDRPTNWDTANLGPGILNVEKLLQAELPKSVAAGGIRTLKVAGPPRAMSPLENIERLFPTTPAEQIRESLQKMFAVSESELNGKLNEVADELMYYAVMDPKFRAALAGKQTSQRTLKTASTTERKTKVDLPKNASQKLKTMAQL